jgi:hypothetical protein
MTTTSRTEQNMKVLFNDVGEFLTELRSDADEVEQKILRLTIRRRCQQPFVYVSVVSTVLIGRAVVTLDHRLGETFIGEDLHQSEVGKKADAMIERISEEAKGLGLEVRAGVYEPAGGN